MRITFTLLLISSLYSCEKKSQNENQGNDYVLIEFAARLEENYYQLYPEEEEKNQQK